MDRNEWQKNYRKINDNKHTKIYEKTKKGFLVRLYRNMQSRVTGVQKLKIHLYKDKELLERESFYKWAMEQEEFHRLFDIWEKSKYERRLTPSVNRIDPSKGYIISNIEWVAFHVNCSKTSRNKYGTK
jgi:hypothetical protein